MKLAPKLTILFLLLAIVPTAVVGYLAYENGRRTIVQETIDHLVSINIFKSNELKRWVKDNENGIEELAQQPLVRQYAAVLAKHDTPDHAYQNAKASIIEDHLKPRLKYGGFFELFLMCPRHGLISASTDEKQEGKYRDTYPYFIEGKSRTHIHGIYYSPVLEQPAMTMSAPIKDTQGNLMGVLAGRLDLGELSKIIALHTSESQTEDTYLVNTFNFFVTEPRFGQGYALKKAVRTEGVEAGLSGKDGVGFYKDYRGMPVIGAYKWLPEFKMCIITEIDQAEAFAPIVHLAWVITAIASAISIAAGLLGLFFARTISRPMRKLAIGAEEVGGGNLEYKVGTASKDEIGELSRMFDRMSENLKIITVSHDELVKEIGKRKLAEKLLRATSSRQEAILDAVPDIIMEVDNSKGYTWANQPGIEFFGEDVIGKEAAFYFEGEQDTYGVVQPLFNGNENVIYVESWQRRKDGQKRLLAWWCRVLKDEQGNVTGALSSARDITERKRAEEAIKESEKRYRQVIENATEIIYSIDTKGNFTYGNPAGLKVTGFSLEELQQFNYQDVVVPEHRERITGIYIKQFRERQATTYVEFPFFKKSGEIIWFGQNASLVIEDGKIVGFHVIARDITERKQAEKALQESEEKYRLLVENANEAIFVIQDGMLRFFNIKNIELIGYSKEELTSTPFINFVHPDDLEVVLGRYLKRIRGEEPPGVNVFRVIDKAGNIKWAEVNSVLISWEGKPATLNFLNDITERKRAEEALRESEERYRTILDNIEDGYFEVDIAGSFTFFNDCLCRILGYSRDETMGMNNKQYMDKENAKKVYQTFNKVYTTGEPQISFDWEIIRKDCTKRFIESSVSLIRNSKSEQIGFRGVVRDVTDRKQAEIALKESEKKFKELFDNAPVGYHEFDIEGRITSVNRTELEMLGYTLEERIGQFVWSSITEVEKSRQTVLGKLAGVIPPSKSLERTYHRKDGTTFPVLIQDQLFRDPEGKIIGIRSTIQDISEPKRAEQEMAFLQEQLRQSQKIEAIGRLSGGIAHDFNNLLTTISGNAQLSLLDLKQGDPLRENIEEIRRASERAADLTRQLLAFSRKQVMEMRVLDLNLIVQGLDKMLHRLLGEDIDLVTVLPEGIGRVKADPGQIEQVIVNLAVNAKDAMIEGGKLTIETANVELDGEYARKHIAVQPGRYVMLSISDTGQGMTPEVKERIFEPFFTTKEKGKGTGLGLSTVYGIVKQSRGNIWVYSEPDKGATFKIYLPRVDEPIEESKEKVVKEEILTGSETILVVEDDEEVKKLAVRILKKQGYNVLEASQGLDAFLICEEHEEPMHLLLTDVVMPKMSGRELADRIVSIHPEIKVLYMSGYTDNAISHHGILEKGTNFLQKPFTVDGLARKVREVLDK